MIDPESVVQARRALGRQLAAYRRAAGLSQQELAQSLHYGRSSIANVETGRQNVSRAFWQQCDELTRADGSLIRAHDEFKALVSQELTRPLRPGHQPCESLNDAVPGEQLSVTAPGLLVSADVNLRYRPYPGPREDSLGVADGNEADGTINEGGLIPLTAAVTDDLEATEEIQHLRDRDFGLAYAEVWDRLQADVAATPVATVSDGTRRLGCVPAQPDRASAFGIAADLLAFVAGLAILEDSHESQAVSRVERRDFAAAVTAIALGVGPAESLYDRLSMLLPSASVDPPRRVGVTDVERIEATTTTFREWDNRWGGGLSRTAVLGQLQWVIATGRSAVAASSAVRRRLLVATADLASLGAWINYDVERHQDARRLWIIALDASREARNRDLVSAVLRQMAHQALHLNRPEEALGLVRLAYATSAMPDREASELGLSHAAVLEAWCHAVRGRYQPFNRALGRAEDHFGNCCDYEAPPWLAHFDDVEFAALRGHAYHVLADRMPGLASAAEPLLNEAVVRRGPLFARSKTLNLIALSSTYFQQGGDKDKLEKGVEVGYMALEGARTLNSPRSLSRLHGLDRVSARHASKAHVAEFRDQLHLVLADAG